MPLFPVVNTPRWTPLGLVPLALATLVFLAHPAGLRAQDEHHGKIKDVEHSADNSSGKDKGHDHHDHDADASDDGDGFFERIFVHALFWTPRDTGQGYLSFPYAKSNTGSTFVLPRVYGGRSFFTLTGGYFKDAQSTLRAWDVGVEWAGGALIRDIEYTGYSEPLDGETDHLHLVRFGLGALRPIGTVGYFQFGAAAQGVILDDGRAAGGPELVLGVQVFPKHPLGVGGTLRLAPLTWEDGPAFGTGFVDATGHVSVIWDCAEMMLGYRWTRVGVGAPFSGVTLGLKLWIGPERSELPQQGPADEPEPLPPR